MNVENSESPGNFVRRNEWEAMQRSGQRRGVLSDVEGYRSNARNTEGGSQFRMVNSGLGSRCVF